MCFPAETKVASAPNCEFWRSNFLNEPCSLCDVSDNPQLLKHLIRFLNKILGFEDFRDIETKN